MTTYTPEELDRELARRRQCPSTVPSFSRQEATTVATLHAELEATRLSHVYGVGLTTIGLFVTAQFVVHMLMQVPGGRAADRFGSRTSTLVGLGLILVGNGISLVAPQPWSRRN